MPWPEKIYEDTQYNEKAQWNYPLRGNQVFLMRILGIGVVVVVVFYKYVISVYNLIFKLY